MLEQPRGELAVVELAGPHAVSHVAAIGEDEVANYELVQRQIGEPAERAGCVAAIRERFAGQAVVPDLAGPGAVRAE